MNLEATVMVLKRIYRSVRYHLEILELLEKQLNQKEIQERIINHKEYYQKLLEETEAELAKYDITPEYESDLKKVLIKANLSEDDIPERLIPVLLDASREDIEDVRKHLDIARNEDAELFDYVNRLHGYNELFLYGLNFYYPRDIRGI